MSTKVFHLTLDGPDSDFGPLTYCPVKVTIESTLSWEESEIKEFKGCLSEYFDINLLNIRTDEEEKKDADDLNKYLEEELKRLSQ